MNDLDDLDPAEVAPCDRCGLYVNTLIETHSIHGDVCWTCLNALAEEDA